mgnify:CR=1 FL=1
MPETFPPPLKAVPLGKVSKPKALTEGVFLLVKMQCRAAHRPSGIALLRFKLREWYFPHVVGVQPGFALLFKHGGDQLVQVL